MLPCLSLSIIRYGSRESGAIKGEVYRPSLILGVVAIEKEAFGSPSTLVGQLMYIYSIYMFVCVCACVGWLVGFYDISTFVGYLMPNPFLYK